MRLAAQTHCTLEELGERMSAEEFGLWSAFLDSEPIGPAGAFAALAELLAALANGPLQPPQGRKSFRAQDFIDVNRWQPPEQAPPPAEPDAHAIAALFRKE